MADFTSALYLGLAHASDEVGPWRALTTGAPAVLGEPPRAGVVAAALAARIGCRRGLLGASTLHLFHDVFEQLARRPVAVFLDGGVYPIARWGAERAALSGAPVFEVRHFDPVRLRRDLARTRRRPVVVVDGFCPGCSRPAPLAEYLEAVRERGGWLVVDDTQALGIFGRDAEQAPPYGRDGGGSVARAQLDGGEDLIVIASLAKGYGAPVAVAAGGERTVEELAGAPTRVHCSPPSAPAIAAAARALAVEVERGEALRRRLWAQVKRLRDGLRRVGLAVMGGIFPIQRLAVDAARATSVWRRLLARGVRAALLRARCSLRPELTLLVTARHRGDEIDRAVAALDGIFGDSTTRGTWIHAWETGTA